MAKNTKKFVLGSALTFVGALVIVLGLTGCPTADEGGGAKKSVAVGTLIPATIKAGATGAAPLTVTGISDAITAGTVEVTPATAGITGSATKTAGVWIVTITVPATASAGSYKFTVTIDGVTSGEKSFEVTAGGVEGGAPSITAVDESPAAGDTAIGITGTGFKTSGLTLADFTIGGAANAKVTGVAGTSTAARVDFTTAALEIADVITVKAKASAFTAASADSNPVTFTAVPGTGTSPSATVGNVTITGTAAAALPGSPTVTITLTGDTFTAQAAGTVTWITNAPTGVTQTLASAVTTGAASAVITLGGTPTAVSSAALAITIPGAALTSGTALTVTANGSAKWAIAAAAGLSINGRTFTVDGAAPTVNDHIWRNGTANIQVFESGALNTYTSGDTNYALVDALLNLGGMQATDKFTFDSTGQISAIEKVSYTAATPIVLATSAALPVTAFASALTLTGNGTNGFKLASAWSIPSGGTLTVAYKTTLDLDTFDLAAAGSLVLNADPADGAKITGTGKVTAGKTEITAGGGRGWQAVGTGTVTITTTGPNTSSITANPATAVLTAKDYAAKITQLSEAGSALVIAAGTTVSLGIDGSLVLNAAAADGAQIVGPGNITAAMTEITGGWQAVGTGTVTIKATGVNTSSITADAGTAVFTATGSSPKITQLAGAGNDLSIMKDTTINLAGNIATSTNVGSILLKESVTSGEEAKITLADSGSVILVDDTTTEAAGTVLTAAGTSDFVDTPASGKITVSSFTDVQVYPGISTTGKVKQITGGAGTGTLKAYGGGTGTKTINTSTAAN